MANFLTSWFSRSKATPPPPPPSAASIQAARDAANFLKSFSDPSARDSLPPPLRQLNDKMTRAFDAAWQHSYDTDFRPTYNSADAEILVSDYQAVARARTLCKDRPHGKAIIRSYMNNVVGHRGFRLDMRVGQWNGKKFILETETNRMLEEWYAESGQPQNFSTNKTWSRMKSLRVMEASAIRDGRVLLRRYRGFPHNRFGYAVKLLEQDHLDARYMGKSEEGNPIRFSIEYDATYGFPIAYWILSRHPGDPFGYYGPRSEVWRERVPAEDIIVYNNLPDRAEQSVGFTELDSIIQASHRNDQYSTALTLAAIASCCKPYWIKKNFPTGMTYTADEFGQWLAQMAPQAGGPEITNGTGADSGAAARQQGIGARTSLLTPAKTETLDYGSELQQLDPRFPVEAAHEFKGDNESELAVGAGISFAELSGKFVNMGFSAARMSTQPARDNYKVRQANMIDDVVMPEFRESLRGAILAGAIALPLGRLNEFCRGAVFKGRGWASANPLQDIQATLLQLEAGIVSEQQVQDDLPEGVSIADLYCMIAEAQEMQKEQGLDFTDADVTKPVIQTGEPDATKPAANDIAQPPPKSRPANPVRRGIKPQVLQLMAMTADGKNGHG